MDWSQVDVQSLMSRPIRVLVELIGLPETLKLLEAKGGTTIKIPISAKDAKVLSAILSKESVKVLCKAMPGKELLVPKKDKVIQKLRNLMIIQQRRQKSASKLALEFNLSRRMIIYIAPLESNQSDLFGEANE